MEIEPDKSLSDGKKRKMSNGSILDSSKAGELSAKFSITIFLSLCVLVSRNISGYENIIIALWVSSGLFGAASMKYLDSMFDHIAQSDSEKIVFSLASINGRSLLSFDDRWKNIGFLFYFIAWLAFVASFYFIGLKIFSLPNPNGFFEIFYLVTNNVLFAVVMLSLSVSTVLAATVQLIYVN